MDQYKKYGAEFIGTFWLVLCGCGAAILATKVQGGGIGLVGVSLAFGLSVLTMAFAVGPISGAHLNPAVTLGLFTAGRFPGKQVPPYIVAQVLGAVVASLCLYIIASGQPGLDISGFAANGYGENSPEKFSVASCFFTEVLFTFMFIMIIIGSTGGRASTAFAPISIGLALTLIHLVTIPVTNTSVNPARSTGPALMAGGWAIEQLWLFWVAPLFGGGLAGALYKFVSERTRLPEAARAMNPAPSLSPTTVALVAVLGFSVAANAADTKKAEKKTDKQAATKGMIEPKAEEELKKMCNFIGQAKALSVSTTSSTELVSTEGQKINFDAESKVSMERPNKLRTDRIGEIANTTFYYDGSQVAVYGKGTNFYAKTAAPKTIDETIDFTREKLGIEAPAADLLYEKPCEGLMTGVDSGHYIGTAMVNGERAHHLAFRGKGTDWQIWIASGDKPFPLKYEIVSTNVKHEPEFTVEMRDWQTEAKFPADHFKFTPPEGAQEIAFAGDVKNKKQESRVR